MKAVFGIILGVLILGFGLDLLGLAQYGFFAPKYEQVRRNVYAAKGRIACLDLSKYGIEFEINEGLGPSETKE